jgi:succinate dehydrogenase / fumarate reductase iron-sulfur subunit
MSDNMNLKLKIWRQKDNKTKGNLVDYTISGVSPDMSFLDTIDMLKRAVDS